MYFHEHWYDTRLMYNASLFGAKTALTLPAEAQEKLWTPDTAFINALRCQTPQTGSVSHLGLLRLSENGSMFSSKRYKDFNRYWYCINRKGRPWEMYSSLVLCFYIISLPRESHLLKNEPNPCKMSTFLYRDFRSVGGGASTNRHIIPNHQKRKLLGLKF